MDFHIKVYCQARPRDLLLLQGAKHAAGDPEVVDESMARKMLPGVVARWHSVSRPTSSTGEANVTWTFTQHPHKDQHAWLDSTR